MTSPRPVSDEMGRFYTEAYYEEKRALVRGLNHLSNQERIRYARRLKPSGQILDIGCGTGTFLTQMVAEGYEIHGVEFSESAIQGLPSSIREKVLVGGFRPLPFPDESFDLVTLWHVLEHLPNPLETLWEAHRLLKKDGILIVETPNYGSWEARWLGPHWLGLDVPRHFWHFTPGTLTKMAESARFPQPSVRASIWQIPFLLVVCFSHGPSIENWMRERFPTMARFGPLRLAFQATGLAACLVSRLGPSSLPTMRLVAGK